VTRAGREGKPRSPRRKKNGRTRGRRGKKENQTLLVLHFRKIGLVTLPNNYISLWLEKKNKAPRDENEGRGPEDMRASRAHRRRSK